MNTIETMFEWLLAASLRASVLAVAILGIQFVLRHRLPAVWRHALWLPMLAVLVLPVLPEAPFALFPRKVTEAAPFIPRLPSKTAAPVVFAAPLESTPFALPVPAAPAPVISAPASAKKVSFLAVLWLAGACGVMAAGLIGYHRTLRRIRTTATTPDRILRAGIAEAARVAGLSRTPRTLLSPAVASPAVTGFVRPLLPLPAEFPAGFSATEARLILLHEFSHLKRLDLPLNWLMCILQAIHWFNPLLWFAFARIRADREMACDAHVLSIDATDRRAEYGGALLKLQCVTPSRALSLGFVGIFERGSEIKARIREISAHRPGRASWRITGGIILTLLMIFGVTKGQQADAPIEPDNAQKEIQPALPAEATLSFELLKQVREQEARVEERRKVLTTISRNGAKFSSPAYDSSRLELEEIQHESQIQSLLKYDSEALLTYASDLDMPDNTIKNLYPRYVALKTNIEGMKEGGLGDRHPTIVSNKRILDSIKDQLDEGLVELRTRLQRQLDARRAYERDLALLEQMKLKLISEDIARKPSIQTVPASADPEAEGRKASIQRKLDSITIPSIDIAEGTALEEVVGFLRLRAAELDKEEKDSNRKGVNFVIIQPRHAGVEATPAAKTGPLQLRNAPLGAALKYICEQAGFHYTMDDTAVILSPKAEG